MSAHVSSVRRSAYCFLHQLRQVVRSVSVDAAKTVIHAFISSRFDYCNSLLYAFPTSCSGVGRPYKMLQHAWLLTPEGVTTSRRSCSNYTLVTSTTACGINLAVLVYKTLNNLASLYLSDNCQLVATNWAPSASIIRKFQVHHNWYQFTHVFGIEHSLLPDHVFGTVFLHMSVDLICPRTSATTNVCNCSRYQRLVTLAFSSCVQMFLLTYLLTLIDCLID